MKLSRGLFLGFIKLHILYHAGQEPVFGLWLIEELARRDYRLSPGTLYPILHALEQEGLLVSESRVVDGKMRKYYSITTKGQSELEASRLKAQELLKEIENH